MSDKEKIQALLNALNEVADWAEGNGQMRLYELATEAVRRCGRPVDSQRGLFAEVA